MSATLRSIEDYHRVADRLRGLPAVIAADVLERDPRTDGPAFDPRLGGHWIVLAV